MIRAILSDHELNVFFISPRTRLAFDAAEFTCSCYAPLDEMRTLKSLSHSITPYCNEIILWVCLFSYVHDLAFLWTLLNRLSLTPLNYLVYIRLHIVIVPISSSSPFIFPSSGYIYQSGCPVCRLYNINSKGPRTDPCGTPLSTSHQLEQLSPITTRCFLPIRKALIQSINLQPKPYALSL